MKLLLLLGILLFGLIGVAALACVIRAGQIDKMIEGDRGEPDKKHGDRL